MNPVQNDQALLVRLKQHDLDFVVIEGVCCVYYGVPIATFDLDICCRFVESNLKKLETALRDLHSFHRFTPQLFVIGYVYYAHQSVSTTALPGLKVPTTGRGGAYFLT